jgi:hypothetical protein
MTVLSFFVLDRLLITLFDSKYVTLLPQPLLVTW